MERNKIVNFKVYSVRSLPKEYLLICFRMWCEICGFSSP